MGIEINRLQIEDCGQIAEFHKIYLPNSYLNLWGVKFLQKLYLGIDNSPDGCVWVAKEKTTKKILGFIAGTQNIQGMYSQVLRNNFFSLLSAMGLMVLNPKNILYLANFLMYPYKKMSQNKVKVHGVKKAELLSLAVDANARGKGIGKLLVEKLNTYYQEKKVPAYFLFTDKDDTISNRFYQSLNFQFIQESSHFKKVVNEYKKDLSV